MNQMYILRVSFILLLLVNLATIRADVANAQSDFLKRIDNEHWDYQDVLVLGVGADWNADEVKEILENYHFDKVIVISDGSVKMDYVKAALAKLGIPTGTIKRFEELKGRNIKRLYAHSWGSSETINFVSKTEDVKVGELHCFGSPESALINRPLNKALGKGRVDKVFFHVNDGDIIAKYRHLPKMSTPGFSNKIEFHFYKRERQSVDTKIDRFGFDKYYHYNCTEGGHPIKGYFKNLDFVINRDPKSSAFRGGDLPLFYTIPSYRTYSNRPQSLTEAQTMTEMTHDKRKALIVGKGPEADLMYKNMVQKLGKENVKRIDSYKDDRTLQLEAKRFGADVILGVKGVGGVWVDPKPSSTGKGGSEIKKKVIESRPSEDALFWEVK